MSNCSGIAIQQAFERVVRNQIPNKRWLGPRNYYRRDTVRRMDAETTVTYRKRQVEEYIAGSVIIHSSDGWGYLTRSIDCLLNGDIPSAIHFAYYAELRSAMSLMAYDGVGVFNRKHIYFDALRNGTVFGGYTTHSAVDKGMKAFANLSSKKEGIFKLLKVQNHTIADWIRETNVSSQSKYSASVINRWLKKWSIDLHLYDDQQLRNEMSYRPHFISSPINLQLTVNKLIDIWELLEPTAGNRFPKLDRHLLRIGLEEIYQRNTGLYPTGSNYETFIGNIFGRLGEPITQLLYKFLLRQVDPNDALLFTEAKGDRANIHSNISDPFPIICRAILLLRLSTGAANQLICDSTLDIEKMRFWWEDISLHHGFTASIPSEIDAIDLYSDIRDSITEISSMSAGSLLNIKDSFGNVSRSLFFIKQFQRACIWGIGL